MTLRKIAALGLAASTLALAVASVAGARGAGDISGPKCADIVDGNGGYAADTASVVLLLAEGSCQGVTYTLVALDQAGGNVVGSYSVAGDGSEQVPLSATISGDTDNTVCVYVQTSAGRGPHVFDRGPDADGACVNMTEDGSTGFQDFS
jgi:hypothetical protein